MHNSTSPHQLSRGGGAASTSPMERASAEVAEDLAKVIQLPLAAAPEEAARPDRSIALREIYNDSNEHNLNRHLGGVAMCDDNLSRATEQAFRP